MVRLFVYGTLKRGFSNAARLDGAAFERRASTSPGYAIYMVMGYPALVTASAGVVHGELYGVSDEHIALLDAFEEVPHRYRRETIVLDDGTCADAYVGTTMAGSGHPMIDGGRFRE